jgi:O-antigen ligase
MTAWRLIKKMNDLSNYLFDFLSILVGLIFAYWPFVVAIVLGFLLPTTVVVLSNESTKWNDHLKLTTIFATVVIGSTLAVAFSGRTLITQAELDAHPSLLATISVEHGNYWFSRLAHLVLLTVSMSEIFSWITRKRHMGETQFFLWITAMIYFVLSVLVSGVLGHFREFDIKVFYAPIVFTAVTLLVSSDYQKTLRTLRWILLIPLLGSLVAIWVAPHLVLETGYNSLIPGIHIRLAGLTEHANSLGLLAVVALFLELSPFVCNKPNIFLLLISLANLVLAQSKTAWVIAIIGFLFIRSRHVWKAYTQNKRSGDILGLLAGILILVSTAVLLIFSNIDSLQSFLNFDRNGLMTFTGRTIIWEVTWREFLNNPISGYGPSIWDHLYRFQHGMMYAGQAHNQYVQTLGQAGLLGILSLALYLMVLIRKGLQGWDETFGFSILMVIVLLMRGLSESPMRMIGIMDFDSFVHLLTFATVAVVSLQFVKKQRL